MAFHKKTIKDVNLTGKTVLLHAELDAPLSADGRRVMSDYRISSSLPTIRYLQQQGCKIILISKLGRPEGKVVPSMSLKAVGEALTKMLKNKVVFVDECIGEGVKAAAKALKPKGIMLLENLRFHREEEANDPAFAERLVKDTGADLFVQDCFALAHRKEAGTDAITKFVPSVAGLHLEAEVVTITEVMKNPQRPLIAVVGGAKIPDKAELLLKFIEMADAVAVGGALANNFLLAEGHKVGNSLVDKDAMDITHKVLRQARQTEKQRPFSFMLPADAVVSRAADGRQPARLVDFGGRWLADIAAYPKLPKPADYNLAADELILDIGPLSAGSVAGAVRNSRTVIWNGTMGVTETKGLAGASPPFAHGTEVVAEAIMGAGNTAANKPFSVVGGGDTTGYLEEMGWLNDFNHVSTGGGASLELMAGHKLPAVEALLDKRTA